MKLHNFLLTIAAVVLSASAAGCSSAPDQPDTVSDTRNRAAEYADYGNTYLDQGQFDQALKFFTLALDDNIAIDNEEGIVLSRNSVGETYLMKGDLDKAQESFDAALELSRRMKRSDLELRSLNNLGKLALNRGNNDEAMKIFRNAGEIIATLSDPPRDVVADVYHSTGSLYKIVGDYEQASKYLEQSLQINQQLDRQEEEASSYYMLASVRSKQENLDAAEANLQKALAIDKKIENKYGIADDYFALGLIAEKQKNPDGAYEYYKTALEKYIILNRLQETLDTLRNLERLAHRLGREDEAASYRKTLSVLEGKRG